MAKLRIRVFLSPLPRDDGRVKGWQEDWPTPSGVTLTIGKTHLEPTDRNGLTAWECADSEEHDIKVAGLDEFSKALVVHEDGCKEELRGSDARNGIVDILLLPKDDEKRLFRLRTLHADKTPLRDVVVKVAGKSFTSRADGDVYATCRDVDLVEVSPQSLDDDRFVPRDGDFVINRGGRPPRIDTQKIYYEAAPAQISVCPEYNGDPVIGVVFELTRADRLDLPPRRLATDATLTKLVFDDIPKGKVFLAVADTTAATHGSTGQRVTAKPGSDRITADVRAGDDMKLLDQFEFVPLVFRTGRVLHRLGAPLANIEIVARQGDLEVVAITDADGVYDLSQLTAGKWTVGLADSPVDVGGRLLTADEPAEHLVDVTAGDPPTEVPDLVLGEEEHGIRGFVRDQDGQPLKFATVEIRDLGGKVIASRQSGEDGFYEWLSPAPGRFLVSVLSADGEPVQRFPVEVNSFADGSIVYQRRNGHHAPPAPTPPPAPDQNVVDLSTFPILTETVETDGRAPATRDGDRAGSYAQTVESALRDVLGWRPGSNTAGFQAALAGAFELREVQGHTEFDWRPRGYAVQADLGALTGAQASIYQRAKNVLEQITPLLDGLTPLDPAADPQDTEATRTVIRTELGELVDELAVEGGPRVQRVDELFTLLLGARNPRGRLDPDTIGGQLAQLRDRFGLRTTRVGTLDEERIVTNFRIVVDHVLSLAAGWDTDRDLFSGISSQTSLGTILIQLSRSLDVVAQSVQETVFALNTVFVDEAQRQTIQLRLGAGIPRILLSDLLDWVVRVTTREGPRLIQDAGKDGVIAIAPVLGQLAGLVRATETLVTLPRTDPAYDKTLPDGLRTPRVVRALRELAGQLDDTVTLAGAVQRPEPPEIVFVDHAHVRGTTPTVALVGRGFTPHSTAVLVAAGRPDLGETESQQVDTDCLGRALCTFDALPAAAPPGLTWLITLVTEDDIRSNTVEALRT